ncbi:MAG TPA: cytidylate kinase-like family protein [Dissulfurispiraceae bacterium]|nr:cytidylate kinase-like family protein [Dissulfurispiraceae bacterium]
MAIITISRGSYTRGKEIAEKVAKKLGYECVAREALLEASREFNVPEMKLVRALHDAPSILDRFYYGKESFMAFYRLAFLKHLKKNNIVYHGLAGHFMLKGVSHVLKVRIIADMEERVKLEMEREKISEKQAYRLLKNDDEERVKWSQYVHGIDTNDPSLYDLVIRIKEMTADDAVDIICHAVKFNHFATSPESTQAFDNLLLAADVKVSIIEIAPAAEVFAHDGVVSIKTSSSEFDQKEVVAAVKEAAQKIKDVKKVEVYVMPVLPFSTK